MTTAYTSLLGLALPVTGELSGTWGDVVNQSITSLLDTSVAGTTNVSTDTDVTLTTTTGAANTARQAILLFSGARTALRTVTAPAQSKVYTVINATTGGFSVKLVGVGPTTGVTIVAGESAVCAWNGSDFVKVSNTGGSASFVNLTASGTVTFTGLTASQAVFTNASDELVSNAITGTGNVVMSASPTLTGTISAAAATLSGNLTLSGGTANGVAYLNGSKVVTSGSALTFDGNTFGVTTGTTPLSLNRTGAGTALIELKQSGTVGSYLGTSGVSDMIFFNGSAAELMRLNGTGLGIGTSSPSQKLHVLADTSGALFQGATLGGVTFLKTGQTGMQLFSDATGTLKVYDNNAGATALTLASGNLGLGVTPSASWATYKVLQIGEQGVISGFASGAGVLNTGANFYWDGSGYRYLTSNPASLYQQNAGGHNWRTAASGTAGNAITFTQAMTLDASGRLGVGITSPTISGGNGIHIGNASGESRLHMTDNTTGATSNDGTELVVAGGDFYIDQKEAKSILFYTNGSEKMRLDSSGNLGLGVTPSAVSASDRVLQVRNFLIDDNTNGYGIIRYNNYTNGTSDIYLNTGAVSAFQMQGNAFKWYQAASGTAGNAITFTQAMTLTDTGRLGIGSTSPSTNLHIGTGSGGNGLGVLVSRGSGTNFFEAYDGTKTFIGGTDSDNAFVKVGSLSNHPVSIVQNNGTAIYIDTSKNVGIGTTSPATKLTLNGTQTFVDGGDTRVGTIKFAFGGFNVTSAETELNLSAPYSSVVFLTGSAGTASERARIDTSGNLLVGQTSLNQTVVGFSVTPSGIISTALAASTSAQNTYHVYSTGAGAYRFYVGLDGTINATSIVITAISDQRLKENIRDIDTGLNSIMALKPRRFDWKEGKGQDKKDAAGFIAQEFETVFPECVSTSKAGEDGIEYKNINHETLIPTLVKAIQEQQAIIESLKARLDAANL